LEQHNYVDKEKNQCIGGKNGSTEHSKGNRTEPEKVAATRTEEGHTQNTERSTAIQTEMTKEHRTTEE
jgi:hypothetical protein